MALDIMALSLAFSPFLTCSLSEKWTRWQTSTMDASSRLRRSRIGLPHFPVL